MSGSLPQTDEVAREVQHPATTAVAFDTVRLERWDSGLLTFVRAVRALAEQGGRRVDQSGLPDGLQRLWALAEAVPEKQGARREEAHVELLERIGQTTLAAQSSLRHTLEFVGQVLLALTRFFRGRAQFRRSDLLMQLQQAGIEALPVVGLVSFLLGLILAFVGAIQLETFGATIYVADLVGIAMVRDMSALMTAIVMAGRSGASYAAQLGSMRVTQETDALTTMSISPIEFLVLPRMLALSVMLPLLTLYADFVGVLGGALVGIGMLGLSATAYYQQTVDAVTNGHLLGGLFKAAVYGALVGIAGCLQGIRASRNAAGVGAAATTAVVKGIVWIIAACGLFAFLFYTLGL